ncbi:MAG: response regulator [Chloroflexi bacterium]|nr:response regulator [Chloroflexota bacterium]MCI0578887.1 response regulator [Chloroflexota bacterium]MCI0649128.1 response regulator [Chloroflexota bacterium]MCI0727043.1 response regulator [Chloroflexota bacterium]
MSDKIRVLIVDDLPETRENVRKLLQFEPDMEVIGQAGDGNQAVEMARQHRPDVVLMDINMPGVDGIGASQTISKAVPEAQVIIMSVQSEADYLRRAMLAGARDFLMKPFSGDELVAAIRRVYESRPVVPTRGPERQPVAPEIPGRPRQAPSEGKVVAVFSPKGGTGCTTVAVNLAVAMANQGRQTLILDGSLQFGDVGVMLNLKPMTSVIDVIERIAELDQDLVSSVMSNHQSGLKALLAPLRPEMAELVTESHVKQLLKSLRRMFEYVVVDTSSTLNDVTLAMLDAADRIILVSQQNLPSLKNISRFFDLSEGLEYERDKVVLVVNHGSNRHNITIKDIADTLKRPVIGIIPEDEVAYNAADQGRPLVYGQWQKRPAAVALTQLANQMMEELQRLDQPEVSEQPAGSTRLSRLFGSR